MNSDDQTRPKQQPKEKHPTMTPDYLLENWPEVYAVIYNRGLACQRARERAKRAKQ